MKDYFYFPIREFTSSTEKAVRENVEALAQHTVLDGTVYPQATFGGPHLQPQKKLELVLKTLWPFRDITPVMGDNQDTQTTYSLFSQAHIVQ